MDHSGFQELLEEFLLEARERTDEVESLMLRIASEDLEAREVAMTQAKRELHTLKGNAGMMGYQDLQQLAHHLEDAVEVVDLAAPQLEEILEGIDLLRKGLETISLPAQPDASDGMAKSSAATTDSEPSTAASPSGAMAAEPHVEPAVAGPTALNEAPETTSGSVRLPFSKIDQLVEVQAETLIFRNQLNDALRRSLTQARNPVTDPHSYRDNLIVELEAVDEARQALEKTLNLLQELVTELGMVPLRGLFRSLRRVVYDESHREGKQVEIAEFGGDTPIDKTLLEVANEVLGHLVRNAVIHGIEAPEIRRLRGKPETGTVRVSAALEGDEVRIEIADDGGGIDFEALRAKAGEMKAGEMKAGEMAEELGPSNYELVFADGLSTRAGANLGAGRGVGLSAVKKTVEAHNGRIEIHSEPGVGVKFSLRLPITTSILRSLLVSVDDEEYALPLNAVTESQRLDGVKRHELNHTQVAPWRGRLIPLLDLGLAFGTSRSSRQSGYFIVIEVNGRHRGLAIDDIVGIRDIVVKGLDKIVGRPTGIFGSTILGDGRVIMILDPNALATMPLSRPELRDHSG